MKGQKKYTKLQIFLFLFFALVAIVFITQLVVFTSNSVRTINEKKREFDCHSLNYKILDVQYKNNVLLFELLSQDYDTNIAKITVIPDTEEQEYVKTFSPALEGGITSFVRIEDITINEKFFIYLEECKDQGHYEEI